MEQYGIRLSEAEMTWREFSNLTMCLSADTPLGRVVAIRSEDNPEIIKTFTNSQKQIRNDWRKKNTEPLNNEQYADSMRQLFAMALA